MQEVLSQQEIDSLLEALNSGTLDVHSTKAKAEYSIKNYDFRRPNKFSNEHIRTLEMLHQHFSRILSNYLSGYLRSTISIEVASVGQMIFDEFIRSLPYPTVLSIFSMEPLPGSAIMETNFQFALPVIDLLFGGPGNTVEIDRELTDIELSVVYQLSEQILDSLTSAWKDTYKIEPKIQAIETNPRLQQLYSANEVVALVTLAVTINEESRGMINICFPFMLLEPALSMLSVRQQLVVRQEKGPLERDTQLIKYWIGECDVKLEVVIGTTDITIEEFLQIQTGDVLLLDQNINNDLILNVEGLSKFGVQAGAVKRQKAVQIVSLKEGENKNA